MGTSNWKPVNIGTYPNKGAVFKCISVFGPLELISLG